MAVHRTYCDTLHEMRDIVKHLSVWNISRSAAVLSTLIEECQTYGNRMEAGLYYGGDLDRLHKKEKALRKAISKLSEQLPDDHEEKPKDGFEYRSWEL